MTAVYIIVGLIVLAVLAVKLFLVHAGKEDVQFNTDGEVKLVSRDENSMTITKDITFHNEGRQCATIMDAICRSQLPYEQYDGIEVRAKAERIGEEREDDYFEAVIAQAKGYVRHEDIVECRAVLRLTARKGMTLEAALAGMVDLPFDFIWLETGRTPCHYRKVRLEIPVEKIRELAGVKD